MSKKLISIIAACLCALVLTFEGVKPAHSEPSAVISVTTLEDTISESDHHCSLREAIINANNANQSGSRDCAAGSVGENKISIDVPGQIKLNSALPTITSSLTIQGNPASTTLNGMNSYQIISHNHFVDGTLLVRKDLTIAYGYATGGRGGGVYNIAGYINIVGCTLFSNRAYHGGGLLNESGNVLILNSTFVGNRADITGSSKAGGVGNISGWTVTIINSTFKDNSANSDGASLQNGSGLIETYNSIFATNSSVSNCSGTNIQDLGNNLDSGSSCGFLQEKGSLSNTNPLFGTFGYYGGPTKTVPLLPGSPAIDGVTYNPPNSSPDHDQRGYPRPVDGDGDHLALYDIGAFEKAPTLYLPVIIR